MDDWSRFNPADAAALLDGIEGEVGKVATDWWNTNKAKVGGHLDRLARDGVEIRAQIATGQLDQASAERYFRMERRSLQALEAFTEFMTAVLAQKVADTVFTVIGWAIFNRTGINVAPDLVRPKA